jgi:hypothetical protein
MPASAPASPALSARIIHAALVMGVIFFYVVAWFIGDRAAVPVSAMPDRKILYLGLFLLSAILFAAAGYSAGRLTASSSGTTQDEWWRANLGRAVLIWALVETPTVLGTTAYLLTHDFRTLLATLAGLLFLVNYRPGRLSEV